MKRREEGKKGVGRGKIKKEVCSDTQYKGDRARQRQM